MDATATQDERRFCGRRSRVVLTPRRWRQVCGKVFRRRRWQESPVTEESAKETVKTIAQGRLGVSGEPVVTTLVCFIYFAREAMGATGTRLSLRPLFLRGRKSLHSSGASRREKVGVRLPGCLKNEIGSKAVSANTRMRRPCESRDPYAVALRFWYAGRRLLLQQTSVVMGPCFRRDDDDGQSRAP